MGAGAARTTVSLPLPAVSLVQLCAQPSAPPATLPKPGLMTAHGGKATVVSWAAAAAETVRTLVSRTIIAAVCMGCGVRSSQREYVRAGGRVQRRQRRKPHDCQRWNLRRFPKTLRPQRQSCGQAFARVNGHDVIGGVWIHRRDSADAAGVRRCYRVRAVDYWGRAGAPSEQGCV